MGLVRELRQAGEFIATNVGCGIVTLSTTQSFRYRAAFVEKLLLRWRRTILLFGSKPLMKLSSSSCCKRFFHSFCRPSQVWLCKKPEKGSITSAQSRMCGNIQVVIFLWLQFFLLRFPFIGLRGIEEAESRAKCFKGYYSLSKSSARSIASRPNLFSAPLITIKFTALCWGPARSAPREKHAAEWK